MALQDNVNFKRTCGSCRHYIGGGDWNLCCDLMYDLCHRDTVACDKYEFSQETIDREEERRMKLAMWLQKQMEKANGKMEGR